MPKLTPRQEQILQLVADGQTNREIAHALGISASAVGNFLYNIYCRIGVDNRVQAARWYAENAGSVA